MKNQSYIFENEVIIILNSSLFVLHLNVLLFKGIGRAAVEAMGADAFLRQANGFDECLELGDAQGIEVEAAGYLRHHRKF